MDLRIVRLWWVAGEHFDGRRVRQSGLCSVVEYGCEMAVKSLVVETATQELAERQRPQYARRTWQMLATIQALQPQRCRWAILPHAMHTSMKSSRAEVVESVHLLCTHIHTQ